MSTEASARKVIRVSEDSDKIVRAHATAKGLTVAEAADNLLSIADRRLGALAKYRDAQGVVVSGAKKPRAKKKA